LKTAGIDIGSITTKAAVLEDGVILGTMLSFTGYHAEQAGAKIYRAILSDLGIDEQHIHKVVSTGYGRNSVDFADKAVTEIICHGAGGYFLNPAVRTIIDIGGQDSKAIILDPNGKVNDFVMNDKCAAGTGRFLEVMARAMEVNLDDFGAISFKSSNPSKISSICTVFAESEVISLISKGEPRENIIAGIHEAVASRVFAMIRRLDAGPPIMMTGGVAKNVGVVRSLEKRFDAKIEVSGYAQLNGAIGAAVLALDL